MKLFDFTDPFFAPAWRRVVILAVCFGWGLFELLSGAVFWAIVFIGLGAVAAYVWSRTDWTNGPGGQH